MHFRLPTAVAAAALFATPVFAAQIYDGSWTMSALTREGGCSAYSFDVGIVNGRIETPAGVAISGSGNISAKGRVAVAFIAGSNTINASGQASANAASGRWEAPTLACSGSWSAQKH